MQDNKPKNQLLLACEGLRAELEQIVEEMPNCPEIIYMPQGLHNDPDKMRSELNAKIAELENDRPELEVIMLGYGLCGRGMCGVSSRRVELVIPSVHDCVPLYVGVSQEGLGMTEENSGILWLSASIIEYSQFARHLVQDRHRIYSEKFGEKRAKKMIQAENAVFANYRGVWYIRWPGIMEKYADLAKATADELGLPYAEVSGNASYLSDLLKGGQDQEKFIKLAPGFTIDMDVTGKIVAQPL